MTNCYFDKDNPCGFCIEKHNIVNSSSKDELLEFALSGNGTALFVRQTSTLALTSPKDPQEVLRQSVEDDLTKPRSIIGTLTPPEVESVSKEEECLEVEEDDEKAVHTKQLRYLYTKKWSGNTYFEEELRKIRNKQYAKDVQESIRRREMWKKFQKDLAKERKRDLIKSSGPEWWQEPSRKQICLATSLGDVIQADHEEGVTGRTRQWLLDLGVSTRLTPKEVRGCMRRSLVDPIDFLLETHALILKSQLNIKKKRGDLERPFSINERILLSAVCVLQLPTLLTMLHYILPPPKPYSEAKHIQELLFGDLADERIRYSTPYMEPLPFRNPKHFHDWAFDQVFRALLPSIISDAVESSNIKQPSIVTTIARLPSTKLSAASITGAEKRFTRKFSELSCTPSVSWLIAKCVARRQKSPSLATWLDEDMESPRYYSRRLTRKSYFKTRTNRGSGVTESDETSRGRDYVLRREITVESANVSMYQNDIISRDQLAKGVPVAENQLVKFLNQDSQTISEASSATMAPSKSFTNNIEVSGKVVSVQPVLKTNSKDLERPNKENEMEQNIELQKLWDEIGDLPEKKRLPHAIKVLAEMGDPLAQLPRIHRLPTVRRWLEIRNGKNRILSPGAKAELLRSSRGMWKMAPVRYSTQGPKLELSKKTLTWDKKRFLDAKVKKEMDEYFTRTKEEKVDNARTYFPTMLNHYDHGSKLNRNFRDVFFSYLPSRVADTFVYRPWQLQEVKNSKSM